MSVNTAEKSSEPEILNINNIPIVNIISDTLFASNANILLLDACIRLIQKLTKRYEHTATAIMLQLKYLY